MPTGKVKNYIDQTLKKRCMHFSLMDPDPKKNGVKKAAEIAGKLGELGTDLILVGGSTGNDSGFVREFVSAVKDSFKGPVVMYPGDPKGLADNADAVLFMSLLNSRNPLWITRLQAQYSDAIRQSGVEYISMAYLIVEPGMKVGLVGEVDAIKRGDVKSAVGYALAAEMLGFSLVYLEAGSGADQHVSAEMVSAVRSKLNIPLIVGGGIRSPQAAKAVLQAGADIIVTGTLIEDDIGKAGEIINAIKNFKKSQHVTR